MLAIYSGNMVFVWASAECRKLVFDFEKLVSLLPLWVGDSSRLPDPVSVETAQWSREYAAMSGEM